jgi:hypothetical protein
MEGGGERAENNSRKIKNIFFGKYRFVIFGFFLIFIDLL